MTPNMGAGGSYTQARADPEEEDAVEGEKNGMRRLRWAACDDNEEDEEERQEVEREKEKEGEREEKAGEKESGQEEMRDEKPPG